jgi:hypothetical protein
MKACAFIRVKSVTRFTGTRGGKAPALLEKRLQQLLLAVQ